VNNMDYNAENPFDDSPKSNLVAPPLPRKTVTSTTSSVDPELLKKAQELSKKEQELNRREAMLDERNGILVDREKLNKDPRAPNWPFFRPWVYHNIDGDMSTDQLKRVMKIAYTGWMISVATLLYNFAALLMTMIADGSGTNIGDFILGAIYVVFLTPLYFLVYRILYRAARKQKPSLFILYLIMATLVVAGYILYAVGIPGTGAGGFILMSKEFSASKFAGFVLLASSILWCLTAFYGVWVYILAIRHYRQSGGLEKAKKEMASAAVKEAAKHPDLIAEAAKTGAKAVANNPELISKGINAAV